MALPLGAGLTDTSFDRGAAAALIPILFASDAQKVFNATTSMTAICNTDFTDPLMDAGDTVSIPTQGHATIRDSVPGQKISFEMVTAPSVKFTVSKQKDWAIMIPAQYQKQNLIKNWLERNGKQAGIDMHIQIEQEFYATIFTGVAAANKGAAAGKKSGNINAGTVAAPVALTPGNVERSTILNVVDILSEQHRAPANYPGECYLVIPSRVATLFSESPIIGRADASGQSQAPIMGNGYIRTLSGVNIYVSQNLFREPSNGAYHCLFGHRSGITSIGQFTQTKIVEPSEYFIKGMAGLYVYDYQVMMADSVGELVVTV
jgi:hypothetical protein